MQKPSGKFTVNRILDANLNRLREALRVLEEITRFIIEDQKLTAALKRIRHKITEFAKKLLITAELFKFRNSKTDIGKYIYINELKRRDIKDIFFANIQRAKESVRVLEEFSKIISAKSAVSFKKIRYEIYELETAIAKKITDLHNHR